MDASIIIPAFNAEKTIAKCLEKVLGQKTSRKFEIIVVDDGSTDNTVMVARKFKRVRVLQQKNSGPAKARNNGAKIAKAAIIIFLDSDCEVEENWLEEMLAPFKNPEVAGVQGRYKSRQKELMARYVQAEIEERYEQMKKTEFIDFMGSYSAAFRKSLFLKFNGFDESFPMASGEDTDLTFRMSNKGFKFKFAEKALLWHQHPKSFLKYLKTKFYRAFWRIKLYNKNRNKIMKDSYTPQYIKLQILTLGISIIFFVAALAGIGISLILNGQISEANQQVFNAFFLYAGFLLLLTLIISLPKAIFMAKKEPFLGLFTLITDYFVNFAFTAGLTWGIIKGVYKK